MLVKEIMSKNPVTISQEESSAVAARLLSRHNLGSLPVCGSDGRLRGIVTDRDIVLRCVAAENDPDITPVREIMSRSMITVSPEDDVRSAAQLMAGRQVRRLPVVEKGKVVGVLSLGDMARSDRFDMECAKALSEISANVRRR